MKTHVTRDGLRSVPSGSGLVSLRFTFVGLVGALAVGFLPGLAASAYAQEEMKSETMERCKKATVEVFTATTQSQKGDTPQGSGSGYFINTTGLLVTNNHVADPTHRRSRREKHVWHYRNGRLVHTVITDAGTEDEKKWECMVVYQNEWADQCIMQAYVGRPEDGEKLDTPDYLPILPESRLKRRMQIWTLGFPGGDRTSTVQGEHPEVSITKGHILEIPRTSAGRIGVIFVDSLARPGNSGGPCVNVDGFLVGTLTIMGSPEGRDDTGGATGAGLVPSTLTARFVRTAYFLGKMPPGSDPGPFMSALTDDDGRINIPEFARLSDKDVVFYPNGDRIYGTIMTDKITWNSPLGAIEVPTDAISYVMSSNEGAKLYLEGGNLIHASEVGSTFRFKPLGGKEVEHEFDDVDVVGFRTQDRRLEPALGELLLFDTDAANLTLSGIEGKLKFESKAGIIELEAEDLFRIDTREEDGQQIIVTTDGRRMTGRFLPEPITATIAATGTPVRISLENVEFGVVELVFHGVSDVAGLNLMGLMITADRDIRRIAGKLETGEIQDAWSRLKQLRNSPKYRGFSELKKGQMAVLEGVAHLREGKYADANSAFRKASRSTEEDDANAAFAGAFLTVLKRHVSNEYEGQPLSDRAAFARAGLVIAEATIAKVQNLLRDYREVGEIKKGEYRRRLTDVRKYEKELRVAGVLGGLEADTQLIRLWKFMVDLCESEIYRLQQAIQEEQEQAQDRNPRARGGGARGGRGGGAQAALQRKLDRLNEQIEQVQEVQGDYGWRLRRAGFRIQDPDLEREKDRGRSDSEDEEEDDEP